MFPAPTTIAISTPCSWSSAISVAICSTSCRSSPYSLSPIRASPDSFSRMRRKAGLPLCLPGKGVTLVLENFELMLLERLGDGLARVVDPLLVGQDCPAEEPLREHPLDDLLAMLLGAGLHLGQLLQDLELGRKVLLGDLVAVGVQRRREGNVHCKQPCDLGGPLGPHEDADLVRRRMDVGGEDLVVVLLLEPRRAANDDVLADPADGLLPLLLEPLDRVRSFLRNGVQHLLRKRQELRVLRDGLGLATDGDDCPDALVDPSEDDPLGRLTAGALAGLRHAALAQEPLGGGEVAFGLLERALRVHHPRAGLVAELLYECRRNLSHWSSPPSPPQPRSRRRFPLVPWARARPGSRPQRARLRARVAAQATARAPGAPRAGRWPRQPPRTPLAAPGTCPPRAPRRSRGSRGCTSGSRRRFRESRSQPRRGRSLCRRDR